jgi:hypothetical protein
VYYIIAIHLANCIIIDDYEVSLTFYEPPKRCRAESKDEFIQHGISLSWI